MSHVEGYNHLLKQKLGVHRPFWELFLYAKEQLNCEKYRVSINICKMY
jgi:hypothetical protein